MLAYFIYSTLFYYILFLVLTINRYTFGVTLLQTGHGKKNKIKKVTEKTSNQIN